MRTPRQLDAPLFFRLALLVGVGVCGGSNEAFAADAPAADPFPGEMAPVNVPDVLGGWASDHVVVKVKPGIAPQQNADGTWTFRSQAKPARAKKPGAPAAADPVGVALAKHAVVSVQNTFNPRPANAALVAKHGLDRYFTINVPAGTDAPAFVAELAKFADVFVSAELDGIGGIAGIPNDANFANQWNMNNTGQTGGTADADIDAPEAWDLATGSSAYIIAILDCGVQANHPDLNGKVLTGWSTFSNSTNTADLLGHGTHCAGTAAGRGNDGIGIAGVNWGVQILPVQVVNPSTGGGTTTQCANGIIWATDHAANTISMSLQYYTDNSALSAACAYAWDANVIPVAATGNFQVAGTIAYPAKYDKCMGVGATDNNDVKWSGSNNGNEIDLCAPGASVYSSYITSAYSIQSGTSMATPHVSGLASLIYSVQPTLTPAQIERILKLTVDDKGVPGWDTLYGYGRINARRALERTVPTCPGNVNGDAAVNIDDLLAVINAWGTCALCLSDVAPVGGDGEVNIDDLLQVINGWGNCP